jgi:hypothetical protein
MEVTNVTVSCNCFEQKGDFKVIQSYPLSNNKSISISNENGQIGRIYLNEDNKIDFDGNFTDSAKMFVSYLQEAWK